MTLTEMSETPDNHSSASNDTGDAASATVYESSKRRTRELLGEIHGYLFVELD
jgi:hypothetical protein